MAEHTNTKNCYAEEDKNDALEAFNSFSGARNLFFWLFLLIPLVVVQAQFWMVDRGWTGTGQTQTYAEQAKTDNAQEPANVEKETPDLEKADVAAVGANDNTPAEKDACETRTSQEMDNLQAGLIKTSNYVLTFAAVIYCLILLIGMKLALIGRLGGLAESSKALFLSLIVMVLIMPWQQVMPAGIYGTLFSYQDIVENCRQIKQMNTPQEYMLHYGRFSGLWGLTMLLLIAAQWRSCRAVRKIRRRLTSTQTEPADNQQRNTLHEIS
jgi:hypothetical protein